MVIVGHPVYVICLYPPLLTLLCYFSGCLKLSVRSSLKIVIIIVFSIFVLQTDKVILCLCIVHQHHMILQSKIIDVTNVSKVSSDMQLGWYIRTLDTIGLVHFSFSKMYNWKVVAASEVKHSGVSSTLPISVWLCASLCVRFSCKQNCSIMHCFFLCHVFGMTNFLSKWEGGRFFCLQGCVHAM